MVGTGFTLRYNVDIEDWMDKLSWLQHGVSIATMFGILLLDDHRDYLTTINIKDS